ncbi:hypothetical protein ACO0LC_10905 [Undibacterium sp. JH2W]|uniref:hypothetical protein n=1 Tax=Undibacterium sp. JH2W TaxID=3413037 RepID=UPI003BEFAB0E
MHGGAAGLTVPGGELFGLDLTYQLGLSAQQTILHAQATALTIVIPAQAGIHRI